MLDQVILDDYNYYSHSRYYVKSVVLMTICNISEKSEKKQKLEKCLFILVFFSAQITLPPGKSSRRRRKEKKRDELNTSKQAREFENNGKNRYKFENIVMEFRICGIRTER